MISIVCFAVVFSLLINNIFFNHVIVLVSFLHIVLLFGSCELVLPLWQIGFSFSGPQAEPEPIVGGN